MRLVNRRDVSENAEKYFSISDDSSSEPIVLAAHSGFLELPNKKGRRKLHHQLIRRRCLCAYLPTASLGFALECPWIIIRGHDRSPVNQTRRRLPSSFRFIADLTWRRLCPWWYIDPSCVRCKGWERIIFPVFLDSPLYSRSVPFAINVTHDFNFHNWIFHLKLHCNS